MNCPRCANPVTEGSVFCTQCGGPLTSTPNSQFLIVTTPTVPGFRIKRVIGIVTGLTPRTRGILGQFVAGWQSLAGGEVTAFTSEVEKARWEAIERAKASAIALGANAIVGMDIETSDMGTQNGIMLFSATGTAVVIEPESSPVAESQ
ncbi:MAG: heavy metal-binding domain-containing protein [Methanocella sp.]|jgi:uncharacterized protein YbjQ (UPF0145 family)